MDGINLSDARPYVENKHSNFDLSFNRKFDTKLGDLVPSLVLPVMPSDKISLSSEVLMRMAPFVQQVFQNYKVCLSFYYVPNRVIWHNFDKFLAGGWDGNQDYVCPYIAPFQFSKFYQSGQFGIFDYYDVPFDVFQDAVNNGDTIHLNALPFFAYCRIMLDYFQPAASTPLTKLRDQYANEQLAHDGDNSLDWLDLYLKLQTLNVNANVGLIDTDAAYAFELPQCLYPLDYFTEGRTTTQSGPIMTIPLKLVNTDSTGSSTFQLLNAPSGSGSKPVYMDYSSGSKNLNFHAQNDSSNFNIVVNGSVFNNVASINDFYSAARLQELFQVYGFSGYSCSDKVAAEFGVQNPNSSLQKAQLIFHDSLDVAIGEVFSSDVSTDDDFIAGSGTAIGKLNGGSRGFSFDVPEHGYIIGLTYCYPEASYCEGIPRHLRMLDRFDFPHPLFSELGMQATKFSEICTKFGPQSYDTDFNYNSRYADFKTSVNRVNGSLRTSLSSMTAGRMFFPNTWQNISFNDMFCHVVPGRNNLNRTFNVISDYPTDKPLFFDIKYNIDAYRPLPYYGLPKF